MQKILLSLLIFSCLFLTACIKKEEKTQLAQIIEKDHIVVGVSENSKPFGYIDETTGDYEGFDIDIAKEIAKDILGSERKIKFIPVTPSSRIEAITSNEVDMVIATMTITPQRQYLIDFSDHYYVAGQTAVVREDSNIHHFADLKKKNTIIVLGTTSEQNIRRINPLARLSGYKDYTEAFQAFKEGHAEAISTDNTLLTGFVMDNKGYRLLRNKISQEPYGVGIRKNEKDSSLKRSINITIKRIHKDGTLKELKNKWSV